MRERAELSLSPDGGRLRLRHGPIDVIAGADGPGRAAAFDAAASLFPTILPTLAGELSILRAACGPAPEGRIARAMRAAVAPHEGARFVTPMAAVAGAVADAILAAMVGAGGLRRAYANNGGDVAVHLAPGEAFRIGVARPGGARLGRVAIRAEDAPRGIATSGRGGRSLSLGIADAVTVLAESAAAADAAATLIANAVDLPGHPAIRRERADALQPDSDLGARRVVVGLGPLTSDDRAAALAAGARAADEMRAKRLIHAAALFLGDRSETVGPAHGLIESPEHA